MNLLRLDPLRAPLVHRRWRSLLPLLAPGLAMANPTGGEIIAGQVSIGSPNALTTVINQGSQTAVINWQQFNVGSQELVQFIQPSASAAILNRIVGGSPSEILGNLSANGRVFLINPQGLMFGAGSRIDVGGLMASTLDIKDSDFLAGRYVFAGNGSTGSVLNQGQLSAADGGFIVLAGDSSRNTGLIQARLGDVVLASGSAMTLDLNGDGLVNYAVDGAALSSAAGVSNTGQLLADGGRVLMTADVARGLVANAVNNSGLVRAAGIGEQDGEIVLLGGDGNVVNSGTLDASSASGQGGDIQVLGDRDVLINGGLVDASGATGGGTVRIGGGREGGEGLPQAERTYIARDAVVRADAIRKGQGGEIVAYSRNYSVLAGLLSARGGSQGGAGGFVETSSHGVLTVSRVPEIASRLIGSPGGQWLIDPHDITIVEGLGPNDPGYGSTTTSSPFEPNQDDSLLDVNLIEQALLSGGNVTVTTTTTAAYGGDPGDITLNAALDFNGAGSGTLTFDAHNDILINNSIADSVGGDDNLNLNLNAGGDIVLGGRITLGGSATATLLASGSISNALDNDLSVNTLSAGAVSLTAGTGIGADAINARNRVVVAADHVSARVTGSGDLVLRSVSGQDVVFDELKVIGSGNINATHRNGGSAFFSHVYTGAGSAQVGNSDGDAHVIDATANGSSFGQGALLAFAGNGTPIGGRNLHIGTMTATQSVDLAADGDIIDGNGAYVLNVSAPALQVSLTTGSVDLDTNVDRFSTQGAFSLPAPNDLGIAGTLTLRESNDIRLGQIDAGTVAVYAGNGMIRQNAGDSVVANNGYIYLESFGANLAGTVNGRDYIYTYTNGGGLTGGGLFTSLGFIDLRAYGNGNHPLLSVGKVIAGGSVYIQSGGAVEITGDDSQGDGVVVGVDSVDIIGDSIRSSGNLFVTGDGDVGMSLYAGAGSVDITGALGVYSNYGGAYLDVDAYFGYEDPDEDGIFTVVNGTGDVTVGSVTVRATTHGGSSPDPLYTSVLFAPPLAVASLDADGDLVAGDVNVSSYQALAYDLMEQGYGGPVTGHLNAASTSLLINQDYHSSAGSVQLTSAQVSGYGESTVAVSATDFVQIDNGLVVQDYSATVDRSYTGIGADGTEQTLTETRLLGTATVEIGEFESYVGTLATSTTGAYGETSPDFEVEIDGGLSVVGANAQARIEAGSIRIGADADGNAVHIEAYAFEANPDPQLDESYRNGRHEVRDASDNLIYSSNVAIAQAEFVSTAVSGFEDASQVFEGRVDVSGREAGLRLMAANGGSIRVGNASTEGGTVAGSINVNASGYTIDGNFFDYGHNQLLGNYYGYGRYSVGGLYGYFLPPLDAPPVGQLSDGAPPPYLHWGAGRLQVIGGSFDPNFGQYVDQSAGQFTLAGGLNVSGVGTATADIRADQVQINQAVTISAAQGAVFGQLGLAYYYGNSAILLPETIVTGYNQETQTESGYVVLREISGDPEHLVSTTTGREPVAAATAAYAGISFEGAGDVLLQAPLTVTGLAAEASMEGYDSVTVAGAIDLDGRPEGSAPSYYREDLSYTPYGDNPPSAEPILASSLLIGSRTGMLINAGVVRLNGGVDIRGTLIAALLLESPDIQITGDLNIDAATGRIESNDPWLVSNPASPVSQDLGLAGLRLGSFQGGTAILHGSLSMTGTTDVQLGGVNLAADGAVQLQASNPDGVVSDFLSEFVEAFEHPFNESDGPSEISPMLAAAAQQTEPTLDQLLNGGSRSCFVENAPPCITYIETTGAEGDIRLLGHSIATSSLNLVSGADVFAGSQGTGSAGMVSLGEIEADGSVRLGLSDTNLIIDTASGIAVGNVLAGGQLRIGSLGDISVGNRLVGSAVHLTAGGDIHGPEVGNLSITSTSSDLEIDVDQIFLPAGLLTLSAAEGLNIQAGQLDLNGFDVHANDNLTITANSISLTGGELTGDNVQLTASGTGGEGGLNLTTVELNGATATLTGNTISLVETGLGADDISLIANGALIVDGSSLNGPTGGAIQLSSTAGAITIRNDSFLDGSSIQLGSGAATQIIASVLEAGTIQATSAGGLSVNASSLLSSADGLIQLGTTAGQISVSNSSLLEAGNLELNSFGSVLVDQSTLDAGVDGLLRLSSSQGALSITNGSLLQATTIQLTASRGSITVENSGLETASPEVAKALTPYPSGSISLSGRGLTLRNSQVSGGDVSLLGNSGAVVLDGGQIEGNIVRIEGSAITAPSAVSIAANGFGARGGILDFTLASFNFGTGAAPFGDDGGLFAALADSAAGLFPSPTTPNASFIATDLLLLGSIGGSAQYLLLDTPEVSFSSDGTIRGASNLFLQIAPGLDNEPRSISDLSFAQFVRTLAIGNAGFGGDIRILDPQQPGGKALIGGANTNYLFLTEGRVTGTDSIATNGRVVVVDSTPPPAPEIPGEVAEAPPSELVLVSDEFEPSEDEREEEGESVFDGQPEDDNGGITTDDTGDAKQQCDAV